MNITTLAILVGNGNCNAACKHCAGKSHRGPNIFDTPDVVRSALHYAVNNGATSLSISSAGEPTLSLAANDVSQLFNILRQEKISFKQIKLYTNGIRIGNDPLFFNVLKAWKAQGLTDIYLTAHSMLEKENAERFGISYYPPFMTVFRRLIALDFETRVNIVLVKGWIDTSDKLKDFVLTASAYGADKVVAWPLRDTNDEVSTQISSDVLEDMVKLEESLPVTVYWPPRNCTNKLCLFPNGELTNTWCS